MGEKIYLGKYKSPIGNLICAGTEKKLTLLEYETPRLKITPGDDFVPNDDNFSDLFVQLDEYFSGKRRVFEIEQEFEGTPFQKKVWDQLMGIPYGETISYKELATRCGNPKASRAVGNANNKNPIAIVCPCHRVIGADGRLVGYASGLDRKSFLLELEGRL